MLIFGVVVLISSISWWFLTRKNSGWPSKITENIDRKIFQLPSLKPLKSRGWKTSFLSGRPISTEHVSLREHITFHRPKFDFNSPTIPFFPVLLSRSSRAKSLVPYPFCSRRCYLVILATSIRNQRHTNPETTKKSKPLNTNTVKKKKTSNKPWYEGHFFCCPGSLVASQKITTSPGGMQHRWLQFDARMNFFTNFVAAEVGQVMV